MCRATLKRPSSPDRSHMLNSWREHTQLTPTEVKDLLRDVFFQVPKRDAFSRWQLSSIVIHCARPHLVTQLADAVSDAIRDHPSTSHQAVTIHQPVPCLVAVASRGRLVGRLQRPVGVAAGTDLEVRHMQRTSCGAPEGSNFSGN